MVTSQSVTAMQAAIESGLGIDLLPPEAIRAATMRVLTKACRGHSPSNMGFTRVTGAMPPLQSFRVGSA